MYVENFVKNENDKICGENPPNKRYAVTFAFWGPENAENVDHVSEKFGFLQRTLEILQRSPTVTASWKFYTLVTPRLSGKLKTATKNSVFPRWPNL